MPQQLFATAKNRINSNLIESLFLGQGSHWENGEFWTLSPIRTDSNIGSFSISETGLYHDFATDESGDLIDLLVKSRSLSTQDVAKLIIESVGGTIPDVRPNTWYIIDAIAERTNLVEFIQKQAKDDEPALLFLTIYLNCLLTERMRHVRKLLAVNESCKCSSQIFRGKLYVHTLKEKGCLKDCLDTETIKARDMEG